MAIRDVSDLRSHLQLAIEVELSTIPPYLYAMYSIEDQTSMAAGLIKSVVAEEMLHAALVANVLLAVGGAPDFESPAPLPVYPSLLRHHRPDLMLHLTPATPRVIRDVFMVIERPDTHHELPEGDDFETLGQFYFAVEDALDRLSATTDLFAHPQLRRQLTDPTFYAPVTFDADDSGGLLAVHDRATADAALEIIVHQGEGLRDEKWADPAHQELTHYHKFRRLADGIVPIGAVRPAPTNPVTADFPDPLRPVSDLFNGLYRYTYLTLHDLFEPVDDKGPLVGRLYRLMSGGMRPVARYLMEQDIGDGTVAAPTFEYFDFARDPLDQLREMAAGVAASHPDLAGVAAILEAPDARPPSG